ncbi:MAG: DNA repair protein RecO [Endomicrobium sp.]|jgi:DNA repair protein RecO (recombination protein O)|nr:DNA repair protein RecO [Endomicrobium sp.]
MNKKIIKGIVLKSETRGEYNKLITIYSYEFGKMQTFVSSAKKIVAKLSYATEPLTESEFFICINNAYIKSKIIGANIINNNTKLKINFIRNLYALYVVQLIDNFLFFNYANAKKYILISRIFEILCICKYPKRVLVAFILRFLKLSGYNFLEYLKNNKNNDILNIEHIIKTLSNCSANEADMFKEAEDIKVWDCVENYLKKYTRCSSLNKFLKKFI